MQVIPTENNGARSVYLDLENGSGLLIYRTYWNSITTTWNLDILDQDGSPKLLGQALVENVEMVGAYPEMVSLVNDLRSIDTQGAANRTESSLGESGNLVHFEDGEYDSIAPAQPEILPIVNTTLDDILA